MNRASKTLAALAVTTVVVTASIVGSKVVNHFTGRQLFKHETQLLRNMTDLRPPDVTIDEWEHMVGWTFNLHAYCDYSQPTFDKSAYNNYLVELDKRLKSGNFGASDINWIWNAYSQFCPKSREFVENMLPTTPQSRQNTVKGQFGLKIK